MTDADRTSAEPVGGAGVFDIDPDQDGVSQNPQLSVAGDIDALPDDLEL